MKHLLTLVFSLVFLYFSNSILAQGWIKTYDLKSNYGNVIQDIDGGYFWASTDTTSFIKPVIYKVNPDGNQLWQKSYSIDSVKAITTSRTIKIVSLKEAGLILGTTYFQDTSISKINLSSLDRNGNIKWSKTFGIDTLNRALSINSMDLSSDNSIIITGTVSNFANLSTLYGVVYKIDLSGNLIWFKKFQNYNSINSFTELSSTSYFFAGYNRASNTKWLIKTSQNGNTIFEKKVDFSSVTAGNIYLVSNSKSEIFFYQSVSTAKMDSTGQIIWEKNLTPTQPNYTAVGPPVRFSILKDQGFLASNIVANQSNLFFRMERFDQDGKSLWQRIMPSILYDNPDGSGGTSTRLISIIETNDNKFVGLGILVTEKKEVKTMLVKFLSNGYIFSNFITGNVTADLNKNCQKDINEKTLKDIIVVKATNEKGEAFYANTDSLGKYTINVDSGKYTVKLLTPNNYWKACDSATNINLLGSYLRDTVDLLYKPIVDCPSLFVDISTPFIRRCFSNTISIKYCNRGTVAAQNASVRVTLDSLFKFISSSIPFSNKKDNILTFNLGNVGIGECGTIYVYAYAACGDSTKLGQALCNEAHIFPDSVCTSSSNWSGASINITGSCKGDSVQFFVKNIGTATSKTLNSVVIEDQVLFLRQQVQLGVGASRRFAFKADGSTWRMTVEQEPNHPTSKAPTAVVEGCRNNATDNFNTGYVTMFDNDDAAPSVDIDCQQIVGSFDPNDKTGYPLGYDTKHFINQNQDIEYHIRFQNTGTDTAFTVVVRDTLPEQLNIETLELGTSSHPYVVEVLGKNVLKFTFNNINLVDSFKNEPKSHGFVKFRIGQKKDLPIGTQIKNAAAIYFDFNAPIITNTSVHTIGVNQLILAVIDPSILKNTSIKVYPNPFGNTATFDIESEYPLSKQSDFQLFDITGRLIKTAYFTGNQYQLHRKNLENGVYFFKIKNDERVLGSGKLVLTDK